MKNGLRDAPNILNRIRQKYSGCGLEEAQTGAHNKTFVDEDSLELDEHHSSENKEPIYLQGSREREQSEAVDQLSEIKVVEKEEEKEE